MRAVTILLLAAALAGCASSHVRDCMKLAGPGWSQLKQPPAGAHELLAQQNLPDDSSSVIWLAKGDDRVLMCDYSSGLIVPGCGGSKAYEYLRKDGRWVSRGTLLDFCDNNPDH
ncbi:MAG: hypothetical protein ISP90_13665 [Nevskia sp.]|nr:hypothetical protein [Nevskia sp.]